jgi:hypothetical protein
MKSHEAIKEAVEKNGAKRIAGDLGVSVSLVYKWSEPTDESGAPNPLDRVAALVKAAEDTGPLQWLCAQADGFFSKNPPTQDQKIDVLAETQRILKEFAEVLNAVSTAWQDARVSPDEAEVIRREWDELKSVAETFVTRCEKHAREAKGKTR